MPVIKRVSAKLDVGENSNERTVVHPLRAYGHEAGDVFGGSEVRLTAKVMRTHCRRNEFVATDVIPVVDDVVVVRRILLLRDTICGTRQLPS